jgi:hypothetical protein
MECKCSLHLNRSKRFHSPRLLRAYLTILDPHFLFEPRLGTFGLSSSSIFMRV